ncbi:hypothetical protein EYF80_038898 [Liparis tanakae]|uniref:Uncharacterized protein n=1 Tax=Liparis tanakae TaxID=230148 RepID=A0A4Z2GBC2_9TELE|nr:hypothetical protein EYF80_038898 [Liparis tanakae]
MTVRILHHFPVNSIPRDRSRAAGGSGAATRLPAGTPVFLACSTSGAMLRLVLGKTKREVLIELVIRLSVGRQQSSTDWDSGDSLWQRSKAFGGPNTSFPILLTTSSTPITLAFPPEWKAPLRVQDPGARVVDDPLCHWLVSLQVGVARGRQQSGNT